MVKIETVDDVVQLQKAGIITAPEARDQIRLDSTLPQRVARAQTELRRSLDRSSDEGAIVWKTGIERALEILA